MRKNRVNLTESQLHNLIFESVNEVLNEIDMSNFPYKADATGRNNWWKQQTDTDFPNHGVADSKDWQSTYSELQTNKDNSEKEAIKAQKAQAKQDKANAKRERMIAKSDNRQKLRSLFYKAFNYTMEGDDNGNYYVRFWPLYVKNLETNEVECLKVEVDGMSQNGYCGSVWDEGMDEPIDVDYNISLNPNCYDENNVSRWCVYSSMRGIEVNSEKYKPLNYKTNQAIHELITKATRKVFNKLRKAELQAK